MKTPFTYSHHAYLFNILPRKDQVEHVFGSENIEYIHTKKYEVFKIADARTVIELQKEKTEKNVIFIIEADSINYQAQNALLKTLENPTPNTYFFFAIANTQDLLDTFLSRIEIAKNPQPDEEIHAWFEKFLSFNLYEKFEFIKKSVDKKNKNPLIHSDVRSILHQAEKQLANEIDNNKESLEHIYTLKKYISSNGASLKMILDSLALTLTEDIHQKT